MGDTGLGTDPTTVRRVKHLMRSYVSQSTDWTQYAIYKEGTRYTRNLVDDGNGKYNLLILVWGEEQESPIHDHSGSHCMMKLLDGRLDEELFIQPSDGGPLEKKHTMPLSVDSVAYMHDRIGLHRIGNPSKSEKAVSLHLYSPPYNMCKTFDEATGNVEVSSCAAERLEHPDPESRTMHTIHTCSVATAMHPEQKQQRGHAITSI
ncbi:hypothetical protein IWW50_000643 [Coemansia erecta]|nr:hypothetical protein IWW50_000643 [Coemansia erecta]